MTTNVTLPNGLILKGQLDAAGIAQVKGLQDACASHDAYRIKLNWEAIVDRNPSLLNDFCYYENGRLVGYAALDDYDPAREATAAVDPEYRHRGIFRQLIDALRSEVQRRDGGSLLLVAYRASAASLARPDCLGAPYIISEYHMEARFPAPPVPVKTAFTLAEVSAVTVDELSCGLAITFGVEHGRKPERLLKDLDDPNVQYFLPMMQNKIIGQIGVVRADDHVYIRAVGIYPEYRRRGYGRQLLAAVVERMYSAGCRRFSLDVETENAGALSIYTSCGFRETVIYDYYKAG